MLVNVCVEVSTRVTATVARLRGVVLGEIRAATRAEDRLALTESYVSVCVVRVAARERLMSQDAPLMQNAQL